MVASNKLGASHGTHAVPIPDSDERALRLAVLYGANGAGKSNLCKALKFLRDIALGANKDSVTGRSPFQLAGSTDQPSTFDLQFVAKDHVYRFGCRIDDQQVLDEWLVRVEGGHEKSIYERTNLKDGEVRIDAPGLKTVGQKSKVAQLAEVGARQHQTFLATVCATLEPEVIGEPLNEVIDWFARGLKIIDPDSYAVNLAERLLDDANFAEFAGKLLKDAGTGVDHLAPTKSPLDEAELRSLVGDRVADGILETNRTGHLTTTRLRSGLEVDSEREGGELRFSKVSINGVHKDRAAREYSLGWPEESDGTRRLLDLIPALFHIQSAGAVYIIDEIDRSLHPILVRYFLEYFLQRSDGMGQLIVTTHESNLLKQDLLRRDEVWFAEKDQDSATHLYSLLDFNVRNDLEIRKHYLQGRFGAIPFLGNLEGLVDDPAVGAS